MQIFKFKILISIIIFCYLIVICLANSIFSIGFYIHKVIPHPDIKSSMPTYMIYDIYIIVAMNFVAILSFSILIIKIIINFLKKKKAKEHNEGVSRDASRP